MPRRLVYSVELDIQQARAQARQMAALFQAELKQIAPKINTSQATAAAKRAAAGIQQSEKQITQMTVAEAHKRLGITQQEEQARSRAIRETVARAVAAENEITADLQAEARKRAQIAQQQQAKPTNPTTSRNPAGGGLTSGLGNKLATGAAAYLTVQTAKQIAQTAFAIDDLRTNVLRTEKGFQILSGGAAKAEASIRSIQSAAGGTIDRLTAMQIGNQALALGLADTSKEFGELTTAARAVSLISPVINDVQSAISELGLASANLSWRRLDQLALSVSEVRARFKELQAADPNMDDSAAFLAASVEILNSKYGELLKTQEANASGAERLRVQWEDLKASLATGPVGNAVDAFFQRIADSIKEVQVLLGSGTGEQISGTFDDLIAKRRADIAEGGLLSGIFSGSEEEDNRALEIQIKQLEEAAKIIERIDEGVTKGVPGAAELLEQASAIAGEIARLDLASGGQKGPDVELTGQLQDLGAAYDRLQGSVGNYIDIANIAAITERQVADATALRIGELEELAKKIDDPELAKFAFGLAEQGVDEAFFASEVARMEAFIAQREGLISNIDNQASKLIEALGMGEAAQFLAQERAMVEAEFARFNELELTGPDLTLAVANLENQVSAQVDAIIEQKNRLQEALNFDVNAGAMAQALDQLNSSAFDGMDGIAGLREQLYSLVQAVAISGSMTAEQAAQFNYLAAVASSASASTSMYAQLQAILGVEFLTTNTYASALVEQIIMLDAAHAAGQISAAQHAGGMSVLTGELYNAANAAGAAAGPLAQILAIRNALLSGPGAGTPDFQRGVMGGNANVFAERFKADQARRQQLLEQQRDAIKAQQKEQEKAAKSAAKGFKDAAKSAAKDFNSAAKSAKSAFENVAKTLESALRNVEGLFGTSEVTQEDLDLAAAGGAVNKADDWLRRLRDEVENGKDWADVSIDQAKEALERIGITTGDNAKEILARFEQAWSDSSLFASKENLAFINQDAVRQQLEIQDKIKEGQKNILELFGATVDGVMAGFEAGDPVVTGMVASELASSEDKKAQEWAKALREGKEDVKKEILAAAVAELQDVSAIGAGGGGGGGGSVGGDLGLGSALDPAVWAPMDYPNFFAPVVEATDALNKSGFFEGFEAWKTGAENIADWSNGLTVPAMGTTQLEGPMTREQAMKAVGQITGPGITFDPADATTYVDDLTAALGSSENVAKFEEAGAGIGGHVAQGLQNAKFDLHTIAYIAKLNEAFNLPEPAGHAQQAGADLGTVIASGMGGAAFATQITTYLGKLKTAFSLAEVLDPQKAIGKDIGGRVALAMSDAAMTTQATTYLEKVSSALTAQDATALGKTLGGQIANGLDDGDYSTQATNYITALDLALDVVDKAYVGKTLGAQIAGGLDDADLTGKADEYIAALAKQFEEADVTPLTNALGGRITGNLQGSTEVEGDDGKVRMKPNLAEFSTSGADAAKAVDDGFLNYPHADLAGDYHSDLSGQIGASMALFQALGNGAATFVDQGFQDYDFGPGVDSMIGNLTAAFKKDTTISQLRGLGAMMGQAVFAGFQDTIVGQRWLDVIRDELVTQASTQIATNVADTMDATVVARGGG